MTDYAVVILADMAQEKKPVSAATLAVRTKLPEPTVSKVLKLLARQKIVSASRGVNGGYSLTQSPDEITMALVITATDGPIALTACVEESTSCCDRADHCAIKGHWNPVNKAMIAALQAVSLKEMMGKKL